MRPFVVRLDPTTLDRAAASSAPGADDLASLKQTWNAWNGKARSLLDQGLRIENLYWRRWHMEQRQGPVLGMHASPPLPQPNFPHDLSASVQAHETKKATEDLESFLRNTLQAAQPTSQAEVVHNPPTYDAFNQTPTTTAAPAPAPALQPQRAAQPSFQPPVIHAPQPQRVGFNPSPEWGYTNLPPASQPPPAVPPVPSSFSNQNRIIATPSWTALISDPAAAAAVSQLQQQQQQLMAAQQALQQAQHPGLHFPGSALGFPPFYPPPAPIPPTDPFAAAAAAVGFPFGAAPPPAMHNPVPPPIPSPSFTLPPTATLFSDVGTALSSAPSAAAPPAFFSSYGMYQPVVAPYPRFLTPSPEPSVLGELELELGPSTGEFDAAAVAGPSGSKNSEPDGMDRVWQELENGHEGKKDPFEGMSLAQMRSRANSLEAIDREAGKFSAFGVGAGGQTLAEQAAAEVQRAAAQTAAGGLVQGKGKTAAAKGKRKAENGVAGGGKKAKAAGLAGAAGEVGAAGGVEGAEGKVLAGGKKNRNPHSTQLPGNGQRRLPKEEAGEGHDGPICSHCGSITTPLWRRGPEDELLCNACGLYLKLHGKSRPKTFGKNNGSKRSSNGAAAQAAASGVPPSCNNCGATSTPMWRKDPEGKLCCNACSLYYKLHKVARPASLAQKRKAAAAAKANLAAAAAATAAGGRANGVASNVGASTSTANQLPTSAASNGLTPGSTLETPAALPPLPPVPPQPPTFQLPPTADHSQQHLGLPPGWPPAGFPPLQPNGAPFPPLPHLHHPQPQLPPQQPQQQQQQQQKFPLPPTLPPLSPSPYAQTAWGALAYGIVSAAAAEEAGGTGGGIGAAAASGAGAQPPLPPGHPQPPPS
ncbi:hypothetical protein JCM8547_007357 [Rhodosporidiobolus lusitaniae]